MPAHIDNQSVLFIRQFIVALEQSSLAASATVALHRYRLHAVACDLPLLMIPLSGMKRFHAMGGTWECATGQFLMTHFAMQADIENIPDGAVPYRAWAIPFPWEVVSMARGLLHGAMLAQGDAVSVGELPAVMEALLAYIADADTMDTALRNYRLLGILLALFRAGHNRFLSAHDPSLSARIRLAVSAAPAREWTSAHFEEEFCISGATLRRRLVAEATSLRALIQEARLHSALVQLQVTRKPVKAVALDHGYRSIPSFRRNFAERFG
ncbi:MAG: helix-turn-helix domain-containing protein, partial [Gallionellaceae bacterium]|nr:helix-turn-helix domain-containing protein [Gallionellaceae bacterium]